ncbi:hypothetical protein L195_g021894 [Trifolium pratense]|uniref:Uncharacterized protein n=1 Tax=Trifolium pratense TaxID=57577 RepID=A0A2K3N6I5_TRIPR|nr:hypothetical protein L195_g021894 [Trifolium pratense]
MLCCEMKCVGLEKFESPRRKKARVYVWRKCPKSYDTEIHKQLARTGRVKLEHGVAHVTRSCKSRGGGTCRGRARGVVEPSLQEWSS